MNEHDELLKTIGQNIKRRRKLLGLKQKDLVSFGISLRYYQDIEQGKANLSIIALKKISLAFNWSIENIPQKENKKPITYCDGSDNLFCQLITHLPLGCLIVE